ncbi:PspC domain-containing protein [Microbacterium sp. ZW T5_56]|uniref:PspC domain-containing protein n=1 Tax=Microbacterium sp. ZW T5_56 TaxID=3378081 RepID=UPI0038531174
MTDNPASSPTPPPPYPGAPGAGGDGSAPRGAGGGFFGWLRTLGLVRGDAWVGGVCGGIATRLGIDPLIVRGIFVVAAVLGLPMVLAYAVLWAVLPDRSGVLHLENLFRGRLEPPMIAALVIVLLSFVPVTPWLGNLLLWSGGSLGGIYDIGGALSVLWRGLLVLALIGLVLVAVVAIARRPRRRGRAGAAGFDPSAAGFDPYGPHGPGAAGRDPRSFGAAPYGGAAPFAGPAPYRSGTPYAGATPDAGAPRTDGAWPVPRLEAPAHSPAAFASGSNGTVLAPDDASKPDAVDAAADAASDALSSSAMPGEQTNLVAPSEPCDAGNGDAGNDDAGKVGAGKVGAEDTDTENSDADGSHAEISGPVVNGAAAAPNGAPATSANNPATPAWHENTPATMTAAPASFVAGTSAPATMPAPDAAPVATEPYDTWRQQQDQWRTEHDAWRQQQRDAERIAREQARAESAAATAQANREYQEARARRRASRPRTALWYVALTLGLMAVGGAAVALVAAPRGTLMAAALAFLAATAVGAVAMIVAGIARRRSGFITFLTITSLVIAGGTLVPALSVGRPWTESEVARVDGQILLPIGGGSISGPNPSDDTYLQSFGSTNIWLSPWMAGYDGLVSVEPEPVPTMASTPGPSSSPEPSERVATPSLIDPVRAGSISLEKGGEGQTQIDVEPGMIVAFTITASTLDVATHEVEMDGSWSGDITAQQLPTPRANQDGTYTWTFTLDTLAESPLITGEADAHSRGSVVTEVTIIQQDDVWINAGISPERKR